jgi:hypothetical protein
MLITAGAAIPCQEKAFDMWDWTAPCQDIRLFEKWVADLKGLGFTCVEISLPWKRLEPQPGVYDFSWCDERLAICKQVGLAMRWRVNSYYAGATPDWYKGATWKAADGADAPQNPPSIMDKVFWDSFGPLCTELARRYRGENVIFSPFLGIHAELKWSDWWSYDDATLCAWRAATTASPRPEWLADVTGAAYSGAFPDRPTPPSLTAGLPDLDPVNRAWIAFREHCWRDAVAHFVAAIHKGDEGARISSPLGESYRKESAAFSNLDYWGLTRGATEVVHSYDFFWHVKEPAWLADASVTAFQGITGLPVYFEMDGEQATLGQGHTFAELLAQAGMARRAGAGLKVANYSYSEKLPSEWPLLCEFARLWKTTDVMMGIDVPKSKTTLLFLSKWANYCYRENTQWLHDAQFGVYKLLRDLDIPVRIICEDNLVEDLSEYQLLVQAFSPSEVLPESARARLDALSIPRIVDFPSVPPLRSRDTSAQAGGFTDVEVTHADLPTGLLDLSGFGDCRLQAGNVGLCAKRGQTLSLGYSIGYMYLHGTRPSGQQGVFQWALNSLLPKE